LINEAHGELTASPYIELQTALSVSLRIDHHAHEQESVCALISDHHQKQMISDESAATASTRSLSL